MLTLHFHRSNTKIGKAIRAKTGGSVNHVTVEFSNSIHTGEPLFYHADKGRGVELINPQDFNRSTVIRSITFKKGKDKLAEEFADMQLFKDYDTFGIISFIWKLIPEEKGKWYCSELAMVILMKYLGVDSTHYNQKQSPRDLLEFCELLKALKI